MSCPVCFFREENQKSIKKETFKIHRFEDKLRKYKELFVKEVNGLTKKSACTCTPEIHNQTFHDWVDEFLTKIKSSEPMVIDAFDSLIDVYVEKINRNQSSATQRLWDYLVAHHLLGGQEGALSYEKLFFRARKTSGFDENDIKEYFHIPFSKRHLVGNQRFSADGQPMLYLGSSVICIQKELEQGIEDLSFSAFLPSYSHYYQSKIFSLSNIFWTYIENTLYPLMSSGSNIRFSDTSFGINVNSLEHHMRKQILMEICTFPTEFKKSFIPEYAIPQMLTTALLEHHYDGVIFPSTKDYSDLDGHHRFSEHGKNLCLFVSYEAALDTSQKLLDTFSTYILTASEPKDATPLEALELCKLIIEKKNLYPEKNFNDYIIPVCKLQLHIEYMDKAELNGEPYFSTPAGKVELSLYRKMLLDVERKIF